jgi:hypothetical protein
MKINELIDEWKKDTRIDDLNLDSESLKVPSLHSKYMGHLSESRMELRQLRIQRRLLVKDLFEYYHGDLNNPEDLERIGREPYVKKLMKNDVMSYVEADREVMRMDAKMEMQSELVDTLLEIMKSINNRGYSLKNAIDWRRLTTGG